MRRCTPLSSRSCGRSRLRTRRVRHARTSGGGSSDSSSRTPPQTSGGGACLVWRYCCTLPNNTPTCTRNFFSTPRVPLQRTGTRLRAGPSTWCSRCSTCCSSFPPPSPTRAQRAVARRPGHADAVCSAGTVLGSCLREAGGTRWRPSTPSSSPPSRCWTRSGRRAPGSTCTSTWSWPVSGPPSPTSSAPPALLPSQTLSPLNRNGSVGSVTGEKWRFSTVQVRRRRIQVAQRPAVGVATTELSLKLVVWLHCSRRHCQWGPVQVLGGHDVGEVEQRDAPVPIHVRLSHQLVDFFGSQVLPRELAERQT
mmetsp:Transcript_32200/g.64651  ORF Transcript_32200/g.64651 Transcript_32200/m.64651 type:complete len:308 (+) Transcript_32200:3-926(+)